MNELITKQEEYIHLTNDLTREMDTYLYYESEYAATYMYEDIHNNYMAIRYPGATRGHIEVDNNMIIIDIKLYDDECHTDNIYKPEVRKCFDKYIGMKLVIEK